MSKKMISRTLLLLLAGASSIAALSLLRAPTSGANAVTTKAEGKHLWHCGMHPQVIRDHPDDCPICHMALTPIGNRDEAANSSDVQIDPLVVQNMGVRTAQVTMGPLARTVRTVGLLTLPEPGMHDVSLKVGGWIDKLYVDQEGLHVNQGDPLFELYSSDLQVAAQELISAVRSQKGMTPQTNVSIRHDSDSFVESAKRKLRLWDVDEKEIDAIARSDQPPRDILFRSPASGHIEEKMVVQGSSIQPGMKLLRIADHTTLWLDAQVYAGQLPFVKMDQSIVATVDSIPGKRFAGTVSFIYPHVDPMSRTLRVRATLENPGFELKPGMYATAEITAPAVADAVLCPREAVIDTGVKQIAFVAAGDGHFSPRKLRVGLSGDDDLVQILEGLNPGDMVVTSGQFLMDVESRTIEAMQKMNDAPGHPMAASSQPATQPAQMPVQLTQVYCPMVKADWLQVGDVVNNPYMGPRMSECGEVRKKVSTPPAGSPLAPFLKAYLEIAQGMDADKLDATAVAEMKTAADALAADKFAALIAAAEKLSQAKDLKAARDAFKVVSTELLKSLQSPT